MESHLVRLTSRCQYYLFDGSNSSFEQPTLTLLVRGINRDFLCDTHCGPGSMRRLAETMGFPDRPRLWVFNSHHDWDHVWGNCFFADRPILAHSSCRRILESDTLWNDMLGANDSSREGEIERVLPNLCFDSEIHFPDEGLFFFHSPGHTEDSASLFVEEERILFVGDNLERPLPYLAWRGLDEYLTTLRSYLSLKPRVIVSSHSGVVDEDLVRATIQYVQRFRDQAELVFPDEASRRIHGSNRQSLRL